MAEANQYQKQLLKSYPKIDLLPLDITDEAEVAQAVAEHRTGDTLFEFLWAELADLRDDEVPDVVKTLGQALLDIEAVLDNIAHSCSTPPIGGPKA